MLTISRSILRRFRTLCRRGGLYKAGSTGCVVTIVGGPDGCRIQAASPDVATNLASLKELQKVAG